MSRKPGRNCDKCGEAYSVPFKVQLKNRLRQYYCPKCIGFFLSRYTFMDVPDDPTEEEKLWKEHWDAELATKLNELGISYPQQKGELSTEKTLQSA